MKEGLDMGKTETGAQKNMGWKFFLLPIMLIICLFSVILITELGNVSRTTASVHEEMQKHLKVNALIIDEQIEDMYRAIEALAPTMAFEAGYTKEQMIFGMNSLRDACGFDFVVRTNTEGIAFNYLGKEGIDLSERTYIHKALGGSRAIEFVSSGAYDVGSSYVILAVPVWYDGHVNGVFHGSYKTGNFVELLTELSREAGQGCDEISIITSGGTVIASSNPELDGAVLADICKRVVEGERKSGIRQSYQIYENKGDRQYYYFNHLDTAVDSDWFIVSRMDDNYISEQTEYAKRSAVALLLAAICITAALLYIVIARLRLADELKRRSVMLSDALDAAENAGKAKSRFLSTVSHEMRTPLNAIIGFIELCKDADEQQTRQYLSNTERASKQLLSVINDVLDMSSIETGKITVAHSPFDFRQLIQSITSIYISQCHDKGIEYETRLLSPVDEWLVGDQLRVNQILMNLLGNSVKFTSSGHIWLSISQNEMREDKVLVRFEISDTGCGMNEDMQKRLFRPFEQENMETTRKYGGSGLGLSIVKNLVTLMGGAVSVSSRQGEGSTFVVNIPFTKSKEALDFDAPKGIDTLRVLVVDDESQERDYVSAVLRRMDIRFTCVETSEEALKELAEAAEMNDAYNICLVDWRMPDVDGYETTRCIRQKYGSDVIVIVVSAYDHNQASESAKEAGASLFIPKPLFPSSLFDLFMNLTGGQLPKVKEPVKKYDFTGKRVLLAEDNRLNQVVTEGILRKMGVKCEIAVNGKIAFDMFNAVSVGYYDAILMDVQMPEMNGIEATEMIRSSAHPEAKTIQIIALTANAFDEDVAQAISAGMNAHISKPIEMDEFASALDKAFRNSVRK